jgi:hypothetical protein
MSDAIYTDIAADNPIVARRGDTFRLPYTWETYPEGFTLIGSTAKFTVKPERPNLDPVLSLTTASGITIDTSLKLTVQATPEQMRFPAGRYVYDLQVADTSGKVTTYAYGFFTLNPDVSL